MKLTCGVCMHQCSLDAGQKGICGVRIHKDGKIVCENYGHVTALALDPIEKKPLRCFHPGSLVLSAGSYGCNLKCPFCQNYGISREFSEKTNVSSVTPETLCATALQYRPKGNIGLAFTYNEPLVGWEFVRDTAKLIKECGMKTVLVTNGTASPAILREILPFMDAMNIDLKGFREDYYQTLGGSLCAVKEFITEAARECHVELTTLIVPGENDSETELEKEAQWIASVREDIPLHVTRFFPQYQMADRKATDVELVYRLADVARNHLKYVFVGNC